jgi:hypothetical protein
MQGYFQEPKSKRTLLGLIWIDRRGYTLLPTRRVSYPVTAPYPLLVDRVLREKNVNL